MVRSLLFEFPEDPAVYSVDDAFLFGPAMLVVPVVAPGVSSVRWGYCGVFI